MPVFRWRGLWRNNGSLCATASDGITINLLKTVPGLFPIKQATNSFYRPGAEAFILRAVLPEYLQFLCERIGKSI